MATPINWEKLASRLLVGKKIKKVQWMTQEDAEHIGWYKRPLLLILDDGSIIYAQMDDEGNDGGAMYVQTKDKGHVLPVL